MSAQYRHLICWCQNTECHRDHVLHLKEQATASTFNGTNLLFVLQTPTNTFGNSTAATSPARTDDPVKIILRCCDKFQDQFSLYKTFLLHSIRINLFKRVDRGLIATVIKSLNLCGEWWHGSKNFCYVRLEPLPSAGIPQHQTLWYILPVLMFS